MLSMAVTTWSSRFNKLSNELNPNHTNYFPSKNIKFCLHRILIWRVCPTHNNHSGIFLLIPILVLLSGEDLSCSPEVLLLLSELRLQIIQQCSYISWRSSWNKIKQGEVCHITRELPFCPTNRTIFTVCIIILWSQWLTSCSQIKPL